MSALSPISLTCSLLRALYSFQPPHTLYQLAGVEVRSDLHVDKPNGQFSILTKLEPSAADIPERSLLETSVSHLPGHHHLLVLL